MALRLADKLTALDVGYPSADPFAHPIVGARVSDPAVFERLHSGAPMVVDSLDEPGWAGITAAIVRPDGHVWWATGTPSGPDLDLEIKAAQARWPLPLY